MTQADLEVANDTHPDAEHVHVTDAERQYANDAEYLLQQTLTRVTESLVEERACRDACNLRIRQLVKDEETLKSALLPFARARKNEGK